MRGISEDRTANALMQVGFFLKNDAIKKTHLRQTHRKDVKMTLLMEKRRELQEDMAWSTASMVNFS